MGLYAGAIRSVGSVLKSVKSKVIKPSSQIVNKPNEMRFARYLKNMEGKLPFKIEGNIIRTERRNVKLIEMPIEAAMLVKRDEVWLPSNISPAGQLVSLLHEIGHVKDPYLNLYPKTALGFRWRELAAWKWTSQLLLKTGLLSNPEIKFQLIWRTRFGLKSYEQFTKGIQLSAKDNMHDFIVKHAKARYKRIGQEI